MHLIDSIRRQTSGIARAAAALGVAAAMNFGASGQASELTQLLASNGAPFDHYGEAVDIDGDVIVVGAQFDDPLGTDSGSAYVYRFDGTTWVEEQQLIPSTGAADDRFGSTVSVSGDVIAVGAFGDDDPVKGTNTGSCYMFRYNGTTWDEDGPKLVPSTGQTDDYAGFCVDVSGDTVVVGVPYHDGTIVDTGSAFVFRYQGVLLKWVPEQEVISSVPGTLDGFGEYVAIDGDVIVVGARYDDVGSIDVGSACIFRRTGSTWNLAALLANPNPDTSDFFGDTVDVRGDRVLITAFGDDGSAPDSGSAYLYEWDGVAWQEVHQFIPSNGAATDLFGIGGKLGDDVVVISSPYDDIQLPDVGSAHLFRRCRNGTWIEDQFLASSSRNTSDLFGREISIDGDRIVVGAFLDDDNGTDSGSAFVFGASDIELDVEPNVAPAGTSVTWSTYYGDPNDLVMVVLVGINGVPTFIPLIVYQYSTDHKSVFTVPLPAAAAPYTLDFQSFEISKCGPVIGSNVERLN